MAKAKTGRPASVVTEEMALRARELFGRFPIRSKIATMLAKEFEIGRPTAYKAIGAAIDLFKDELAGRGEVDAMLIGYAVLTNVMGSETAKDRDRVSAATALIKMLGVKAFREIADSDDVEDFIAGVLARKAARLAQQKPKPEGKP